MILNKADSLEPAELLKVNSALTWNLARILKAPEVRPGPFDPAHPPTPCITPTRATP